MRAPAKHARRPSSGMLQVPRVHGTPLKRKQPSPSGEEGGPQLYFFAVFLGFRFSLFFGLLSPTAHLLSGLMVCPDEQTSDRYATSIPEAFHRRLRRFLYVYV